MHCRPLRSATFKLVDRQRTTAWQSAPMRDVSTPTSAVSKNSTGCRISVRNSSALHRRASVLPGDQWQPLARLQACSAAGGRLHACLRLVRWPTWQGMQPGAGCAPEVLYEVSVQQADQESPEPCKEAVHNRKRLRETGAAFTVRPQPDPSVCAYQGRGVHDGSLPQAVSRWRRT